METEQHYDYLAPRKVSHMESHDYKHLAPRYGSSYRQWFVKGRRIRAENLYRPTTGPKPRKPEDVARDFNVPVEAVLEAIHYCTHNEHILRQDREGEDESLRALGLDPAADQPKK